MWTGVLFSPSLMFRELHGMWTCALFSLSLMFRENMPCEKVYCFPRVWCSERTAWHVNRCTVLPESDVHRELHGMWTCALFSLSLMFRENMPCEQVYCSPRVRCSENYMACEQVYCSLWVWCSENYMPCEQLYCSPRVRWSDNYMACEQVYCSPWVWLSEITTWHMNRCTVLPESDFHRYCHFIHDLFNNFIIYFKNSTFFVISKTRVLLFLRSGKPMIFEKNVNFFSWNKVYRYMTKRPINLTHFLDW